MDRLNRDILRLSIPTIVSNITVPLLGICDTAISGHLGSELFLSAIAVGAVMLNVVFWIFGFLRGGTTGLTANALGEGAETEIAKVLYRSLLIALGAGVVLIALQHPLFLLLWEVTGSGEEIRPMVNSYFNYRIWGAPALLATMALSGWFVGMQTTLYPMIIAISMNIINIGASCILVYLLDYGFAGVAIGTMLSNWLGLLVACVCFIWFQRGKIIKCRLSELMHGKWWRYFSVNANLFLRSFFIICVTMGVTAAGARLGNLTLAVNVIVMQFFLFFSFFMDGFAFSGEAIVGLRVGEKNRELLDESTRRLLLWTLVNGLIFSAIYFAGLEWLASLLTDSPEVIEGVTSLWPWVGLIPILSCWAFIYDGFYIGLTDTFRMMLSALLGGLIFFGIIYAGRMEWWGDEADGNGLIWTAFISYLTARGIYLAANFRRAVTSRL